MRFPISGVCPDGFEINVYEPGTTTPAEIWNSASGGSQVNPVAGSTFQGVTFYVDDTKYPFPAFFDLKITQAGYTDKWFYGVWNYFVYSVPTLTVVGGDIPTSTSVGTPTTPPTNQYTRGALRARLATFYSLDETDTQVLAVLNECIQTGYEKVVAVVNTHARQKSFTISGVTGQIEYIDANMGIPTYVGYGTARLEYLPYEVLRDKFDNFATGWDVGDPVYFSLKDFNGVNKTLVIAPTPKETGNPITVLCFQSVVPLAQDSDYPLVPQDWAWLVLERAKIERLRFEKDFEASQLQGQEFVAYMKALINRSYPTTPQPNSGFIVPKDRSDYNLWRSNRI